MTNPTQALERFIRPKTILLTSYRRNGTPVGTPVHIAVDGEHAFVRTWDTTWKFRRIRNNPVVEIAPATWRGQPTGPASRAYARVLDGSEALHAAHALARSRDPDIKTPQTSGKGDQESGSDEQEDCPGSANVR